VLLGAEKSDRRLTGNHFRTFIHAPQGMIHAAQSDRPAVAYQRHARDWDVSAWPAEGSAFERGAVALPRSSVSRVGSQIRPIPGASTAMTGDLPRAPGCGAASTRSLPPPPQRSTIDVPSPDRATPFCEVSDLQPRGLTRHVFPEQNGRALMSLPTWLVHPSRIDPLPAEDAGRAVDGNTRLTSATGIVLLAVLLVEGVTLLSVRQMISLHIVAGVLLIGPALLKTASTFYKFARYYTGSAPYMKAGPPPLLLRILGPPMILSTLALLGTGVALIFIGDRRGDGWVTVHQTCFWIWAAILAVHLLGHLWDAAKTSRTELRRSLSGPAARNRRWRFGLLVASLIVSVAAAVILLPYATSWTTKTSDGPGHFGPPPAGR